MVVTAVVTAVGSVVSVHRVLHDATGVIRLDEEGDYCSSQNREEKEREREMCVCKYRGAVSTAVAQE